MIRDNYSHHDEVKRTIVNILRFYGFNAREEEPALLPEGGYGRVDVVGKKDSVTIGVEVIDKGDVARDARKLVLNGYTYKYIVTLNPSKHVSKVIVDGEVVKVLTPDVFEHELRKDLKITPMHPYFSREDRKTPAIEIVNTQNSVLREVEDELQELGLDNFVEDVFDALRIIYISGSLQVEQRVGYNPAARIPGEYESVNLPPQVITILEKLRLASSERVGVGYDRKLILRPNERSILIGRALVNRLIQKHNGELNRLIEDHGAEIWMTLVGSLSRNDKIVYEIHPLEKLYDGAIYQPKKSKKNLVEELTSTVVRSHLTTAPARYAPSVYLLTRFLSKTTLRDFALRFFEELERLGLAIRDYEYDSRWRPTSEVYKVPQEVFEFFIARTSPPQHFAYYAQRLAMYYVIAKVADVTDPSTARSTFVELIRALEVSENEIATVLNEMNQLGITSRLVNREDASPFIVLDKRAFRKHLANKIREIISHF
ncbi:hypothetical protein [Thermococcus sp. JdF3]|uniref:hypothetical protein n=1 Tax=Thermococcus sp. JdF3 TaxID=1638258 RepID=UPI00143BC88D|nr:hypothetical protein [Thermococcus sp. JdF3]NJE00404.1 hypothetical protein [Thermococcus sp. JdF3]